MEISYSEFLPLDSSKLLHSETKVLLSQSIKKIVMITIQINIIPNPIKRFETVARMDWNGDFSKWENRIEKKYRNVHVDRGVHPKKDSHNHLINTTNGLTLISTYKLEKAVRFLNTLIVQTKYFKWSSAKLWWQILFLLTAIKSHRRYNSNLFLLIFFFIHITKWTDDGLEWSHAFVGRAFH